MPHPKELFALLDKSGWYRCHDSKLHYIHDNGQELVPACGNSTTAEYKVNGLRAWSLNPPGGDWCKPCWRWARQAGVELAEPDEPMRTGEGRIPDLPGQATLFEVT